MSTTESISEFYSAVKRQWPGFKDRAGQQQMIAAISTVLARTKAAGAPRNGDNIIVVQGQTGVGKTVGYVVPAIIIAKSLQKKLVISTGTVALQEQLINRDLPALAAISPVPFTVALAKGRNRYACNVKLESLVGATAQTAMFDDIAWDRPPQEAEIKTVKTILLKLDRGEWNGDRDALTDAIEPELWGKIGADRHSCNGRHCPRFSSCSYYTARKLLVQADVIVANHDLVLSALASQSRLLPDCSDTLYVLDEAHHLPEAAIARFAVGHPVAGAVKWLDKLPAVIQRCSVMLPDGQRHLDILEPIRQLGDELRNLYKALAAREGFKENAAWRFPHGVLPPDFATFATEISSLAAAVLSSTVSLHEALSDERKESEGKEALNKAMQEFGFFIPKITNLNDTWTMVTASEEPPIAKWIERVERGTSVDFSVSAAPISAAKTLSEALWKQAAGVCLTSATVTSLGNFDYFLRSTGLDRFKQVETLDVPSPFDYASQGVFVVPPMKTSPTDAIKHTAELCTAVPSELERVAHGALVLFTSKRQMEQVYGALPATIQSDVLMQGTMIRSVMLDAHRKRVGAGARSILFGLQGLGEGLDLPGQLCEVVIIAKLPFSPPDSPIEEARAEYLERNNRNPFNEITVPAVGLKMQQWTGRGIRTETDTARIVCMDSRLQSKAYGKLILRGLPPFRREIAVAA